jgi:hypothetical protein
MTLQREEVLKQGIASVINYIKDLESRIATLEDIIEDITEDIPTDGKLKSMDDDQGIQHPKPSFELRSWLSQAKKK